MAGKITYPGMGATSQSWTDSLTGGGETPCVSGGIFGSDNTWIIWLVIGLVLGSLQFEKKKGPQ